MKPGYRSIRFPRVAMAWRRSIRLPKLIVHISLGLANVSLLFPRHSETLRRRKITRWAVQLNRLLGVDIHIHGTPPAGVEKTLLLSNHISWLDIFALNAVTPIRFVAKSDLRSWPVIGRLCEGTGTLFIEREKKQDTVRANQAIVNALDDGHLVAVFPEGTTSDGRTLKPFRSSLLQPAIDCQSTIQPVYLRYLDAHGQPSTLAAYVDDISFGTSLWKLLGAKDLSIEVHYLTPVAVAEHDDRRSLSRRIEADIRAVHDALTPPSPGKPGVPRLEKDSRLPGALH